MSCFNKYATATEKRIVTKLVKNIVKRKWVVSVYDGEEFAIRRSDDANAILSKLAATELDVLIIRDPANNFERIGSILLVWGNDEDVISNYTDSVLIQELVASAE